MTTGFVQRFKGKIKAHVIYLGAGGIVPAGATSPGPQLYANAGAPVNGGSGTYANIANPGDLLADTTNKKLYQNTNTKASPTWTIFEAAGGNLAFSAADALTAHSGGGKASALALAAQVNRLSVVAAAHDSALLPAASAGNLCVVINDGANGADLYGAGTDTINDVATANPTFIPAGQTVAFWSTVAGKWYGQIATTSATAQAQPAAPTAPDSTSVFKMQGLAGAITPNKSGKVLLMISGNIIGSTTTAGDGIIVQPSYGTGAAPANAGALAGTQVGAPQEYTNPATVTAADINVPFSTQVVITGLALGTAYWLDLAAKAVATASAVGLANLSVTAVEI